MILEPNEKIVSLRKEYSITQKKLAGNLIKPSTLCSIEKGVFGITDTHADLVVKRFNSIFSEKGIKKKICKGWLREGKATQIRRAINKLLIDTRKDLEGVTEKSIELLKQYDLKEEGVRLFFVLGANYYKRKDYSKAKKYLEYAINYTKPHEDCRYREVIIIFLLRINYFLNSHRDSIKLYESYYSNLKFKSIDIETGIIYNFALALQLSKRSKESLDLYNKVLEKNPKLTLEEMTLLNKSIVLKDMKEYKKAIKILNSLEIITKNKGRRNRVYCNIISCAKQLNNKNLCRVTLKKIEKFIEENKGFDKYQTYYSLGLGHLFLGHEKKAIKNFEKELKLGIDLGNGNFNIEKNLKSVIHLLNLYKEGDFKKNLELIEYIQNIPEDVFNHKFLVFVFRRLKELKLEDKADEIIEKFYNKSKGEII